MRPPSRSLPRTAGLLQQASDYLALTKPRVLFLLVATALASMVVAARSLPPPLLSLRTLLGGAGVAGAANVFNCVLDRVMDSKMRRTRLRPIPAGRLGTRQAALFGAALGSASFLILLQVGLLPALLALAGGLFYVLAYTAFLKPRTPANIVIGGAAGGTPALVGWAAVRGGLELPALLLFALVFLWTPPHFWALAIRFREDYSRAGIPMLPSVRGTEPTARRIALYSLLLVAASLALGPIARLGPLYLAGAGVLGALMLKRSLELALDPDEKRAMALFSLSNIYLLALFLIAAAAAMAAP